MVVNVMIWYGMVWYGWTTDVVLQELQDQCFLSGRGAPFTVDFGLYNFADLLHKQKNLYNTLEEK